MKPLSHQEFTGILEDARFALCPILCPMGASIQEFNLLQVYEAVVHGSKSFESFFQFDSEMHLITDAQIRVFFARRNP